MGLEEADRQEERLPSAGSRSMSIVTGATSVARVVAILHHPVVADHVRAPWRCAARRSGPSSSPPRAACARCGGCSRSATSRGARGPSIPFECAYWPVSRQARLAEQVEAAQNAWRNSTPSSRQPHDARRRDRVAVGLHVAAGVVGVQVEDVRPRVTAPGYPPNRFSISGPLSLPAVTAEPADRPGLYRRATAAALVAAPLLLVADNLLHPEGMADGRRERGAPAGRDRRQLRALADRPHPRVLRAHPVRSRGARARLLRRAAPAAPRAVGRCARDRRPDRAWPA